MEGATRGRPASAAPSFSRTVPLTLLPLPDHLRAGSLEGMGSSGSAVGTVLRWDDERRGAILDARECPGGCWADASVVVHSTQGRGELRAGQVVQFDWAAEPVGEWSFRATRVEPREDLQATPGG